jgi:hypothetical protein
MLKAINIGDNRVIINADLIKDIFVITPDENKINVVHQHNNEESKFEEDTMCNAIDHCAYILLDYNGLFYKEVAND